MSFVHVDKEDGIAVVTISRGKVNALNEALVEQMANQLEKIEKDKSTKSVILTGQGKFFSFGFDIPEFLGYQKESFTRFITKFSNLYNYIFLFPKPVIAALNGHTIAGSCLLATACDYKIMASGSARISLNELTFGASLLSGGVEMLKRCVGQRNAETVLYSGSMYPAEKAISLGLIDQVSSEEQLSHDAKKVANDFARRDGNAFSSMKKLLRKNIAETISKGEKESIQEFVDIWYSESTQKNLKDIQIRS
ncbi:MAG: enoyl-CoA hydratase/isomerase family protein [Syntrophaceae bacterium]|nr:enoyl-CoA hydratase/isomerase family protein [Syntrophaceae bacterium]